MKWQDCLKALSDLDQNWIEKIVRDKGIDNHELREKLVEFLAEIKAESKMNNGLPSEIRAQLKSENELLEWLEEWVENALQGSRGFEPIRTLSVEDDETARNFFRAAFDNYSKRIK